MTPARDPIDTRAVLDRVDLAELVRRRGVILKAAAGRLVGLCPFHAEKSPSFNVYSRPRPGHYHCFGCGAHGDAIGFIRALDGVDFLEAIERLGGPQKLTAADRDRLAAQAERAEQQRQVSARAKLLNATGIWLAAGPADGSPVEAYLRGRHVDLDAIDGIPGVIRCGLVDYHWLDDRVHPHAPREERYKVLATLPAMVAAIQGPDDRHIATHVTWLQERADGGWGKARLQHPLTGTPLAPKKILGSYAGGAIRLTEAGPVMLAGEGIETSMTVLGRLRRAGRDDAVWAAASLGNFAGGGIGWGPKKPGTRTEKPNGRATWQRRPSPIPDPHRPGWLPPAIVQRFTWLGDSDGKDPEDGRMQVERGLARYQQRGIDAGVAWAEPGKDFNDMADADE